MTAIFHFEEKIHCKNLSRAETIPLLFPWLLSQVLEHLGFSAEPHLELVQFARLFSLWKSGNLYQVLLLFHLEIQQRISYLLQFLLRSPTFQHPQPPPPSTHCLHHLGHQCLRSLQIRLDLVLLHYRWRLFLFIPLIF